MKLLRITVSGFRNIAETTLDLDGITALVSPNNYGKSNLMSAIAYAAAFINESPKRRSNMMADVDGMPLVPSLASSEFRFLVEFDDPSLGKYQYVRYGFAFSWIKDDGTGRRIVDETLEISSKRAGRWATYLKRQSNEYRKSYDTRSFRKIILDDNQLSIDVLTALEDIDINPVIKRIKEIIFVICNSLDTENRFQPLPIEIASSALDEDAIAFDDSDLPRSLFRLRAFAPEKFDDFLAAVYTLFPSFEDISVRSYEVKEDAFVQLSKTFEGDESDSGIPFKIRDEMYKMLVKDANLNQPVDISRMSTGTKRIIWLLANTIIAGNANAGCIGIEEIETSIHPRMLQNLLEILNDNIGDTALLLTSHSPFLIQYLKPSQIYVGVPNEQGVAYFKRINEDALDAMLSNAHDRGLGLGEYLFEMMSSEDEGEALLRKYLED